MQRLLLALRFTISFVVLLGLASAAYAVTAPYQLITPTGNSTTDTAAINAARASCAGGQAIFILPGDLAISSAIDLTSYPGCAIIGGQVGTGYDSSEGTQNTVFDCSGASTTSCIILGNSNVLRGLSILGNGTTTVCVDLTTNVASGNLLLDLNFQGCQYEINIVPGSCCSQNNRVINTSNFGPEGTSTGVYCGANCKFNQFADMEHAGVTNPIVCDVGCSLNQFTNIRGEDVAPFAWTAWGSDLIMTNLLGSQISIASLSGNNLILMGAWGHYFPSGAQPCIQWNAKSAAMTNVLVRDVVCSLKYGNDQTNGGGTLTCNNCMLDWVGNEYDVVSELSNVPYDSAATEAALDWQRPVQTYQTQLQSDLPAATAVSVAPDFQKSPNHYFLLSSSCSCTITNPVYAHDGQRGTFEVQQDATGSRTITWGTGYTATSGATLNATASSTTYYPYTVSGTQVIVGNSYHN